MFNGHTLRLSEEGLQESSAPATKAGGMFVPRKAGGSRQKTGLGIVRAGAKTGNSTGRTAGDVGSTGGTKGQEEFRKMLMGGR